MSRLLLDQMDFFDAICLWGRTIKEHGLRATFGDFYRDKRATFPYSKPGSFHEERKAGDVNLFRSGGTVPLAGDSEEWKLAGRLWEEIDHRCSWGGDFNDANHLSWGEGRDHQDSTEDP